MIKNPLKYLFRKKLKKRGLYAVTTGDYVGQCFIFVEGWQNKEDEYNVLALPEMELKSIPATAIKEGLEKGILDLVEILPHDVYDKCCSEFYHRKELKTKKEEEKYNELDNRWKQLASQSSLDQSEE